MYACHATAAPMSWPTSPLRPHPQPPARASPAATSPATSGATSPTTTVWTGEAEGWGAGVRVWAQRARHVRKGTGGGKWACRIEQEGGQVSGQALPLDLSLLTWALLTPSLRRRNFCLANKVMRCAKGELGPTVSAGAGVWGLECVFSVADMLCARETVGHGLLRTCCFQSGHIACTGDPPESYGYPQLCFPFSALSLLLQAPSARPGKCCWAVTTTGGHVGLPSACTRHWHPPNERRCAHSRVHTCALEVHAKPLPPAADPYPSSRPALATCRPFLKWGISPCVWP